jgi:hypothetical protein
MIDNPGQFVDFHFVAMLNPDTDAEGFVATLVSCTIDSLDVLNCSVQDQDLWNPGHCC